MASILPSSIIGMVNIFSGDLKLFIDGKISETDFWKKYPELEHRKDLFECITNKTPDCDTYLNCIKTIVDAREKAKKEEGKELI